jgi:hypothetical protein
MAKGRYLVLEVAELAQAGLELVSSREPIEMLVVEGVMN